MKQVPALATSLAAKDSELCRSTFAAIAVLTLAALAAYHHTFSAPFIFDDLGGIADNPTIRHLAKWGDVLAPPSDSGVTVNGRPVVNLSLALNYAFGGTSVWGYHAFNLAIHLLAGLALWGVLRRTLLLPGLREHFGRAALPLALAAAV